MHASVQFACECGITFDDIEDAIQHVEVAHAGEFDSSDVDALEAALNEKISFLV